MRDAEQPGGSVDPVLCSITARVCLALHRCARPLHPHRVADEGYLFLHSSVHVRWWPRLGGGGACLTAIYISVGENSTHAESIVSLSMSGVRRQITFERIARCIAISTSPITLSRSRYGQLFLAAKHLSSSPSSGRDREQNLRGKANVLKNQRT